MSEIPPKAIVEDCELQASGQATNDISITFYQVHARMLVPAQKYSNDIFRVKVIKPEGVGELIPEGGTWLEHGEFWFDSRKEVAKGTQLEIEIIPIEGSQYP